MRGQQTGWYGHKEWGESVAKATELPCVAWWQCAMERCCRCERGHWPWSIRPAVWARTETIRE